MDYDFSNEKRALLALSEKLNQTLLERDALRQEIGLMNAAIENDAENRIRARDAVCEARADTERLREQVVNWIPFTKAAQDIFGSILVWREDAGTFVAFYDEEQECWFSERGEDLTGDLPEFYAKMPKGPSE